MKIKQKALQFGETAWYSISGRSHFGYCPICEGRTLFVKRSSWLRDNYLCARCRSIPRQRALIATLNRFYAQWRMLAIHESSPGGASSDYLSRNAHGYVPSQFFQGVAHGTFKNGVRCEDLTCMTFPDESLDLMITQDVFEHVLEPALAFREIHRVLKPGGAHVFTMPWYPHQIQSVQRARKNGDEIINLLEPVYHSNPIDPAGSLVTFDWGFDFPDFVYRESGMNTMVYLMKDKTQGLEAEFLEIFISKKPILSTLDDPTLGRTSHKNNSGQGHSE